MWFRRFVLEYFGRVDKESIMEWQIKMEFSVLETDASQLKEFYERHRNEEWTYVCNGSLLIACEACNYRNVQQLVAMSMDELLTDLLSMKSSCLSKLNPIIQLSREQL